jgi:hypothetical protein
MDPNDKQMKEEREEERAEIEAEEEELRIEAEDEGEHDDEIIFEEER